MVAGGKRSHDDRLPGARHVDAGRRSRPGRGPPRGPTGAPSCRHGRRVPSIARRGRRPGGHAHHGDPVLALLEQVDGGEVEVELRHLGVGEVADHRVDDLVPRGAWLEHRARHVPERAEQPVAVLEVGDEALRRQRASDQLRAGLQHLVGGVRAADGGQPGRG